ncbi:hypothetical protein [Vibrio sp. TRT 17S01]|uniref:hypothetical protein n=1 Tax=Vibrio sp. TRT 17S01 TaxID=3418505 RepID=UPI003CF4AA69
MSLTMINNLKGEFEDPKDAKKTLKFTFFICCIPLALLSLLQIFATDIVIEAAGGDGSYLYVAYALNMVFPILGIFILKEKIWAANLACFLHVAGLITMYFLDGSVPGFLAVIQLLFFVSAIRAVNYLNMQQS